MARQGKSSKSVTATRPSPDAHEDGGRERESVSPTATAVAAEAMATGVVPLRARDAGEDEIPGQDRVLQVGDPDDRPVGNAFVGDETPGGDMPTPDQNQVDDLGRAMGVQEADSGTLRTSSEVLDERDRARGNQDRPPTKRE